MKANKNNQEGSIKMGLNFSKERGTGLPVMRTAVSSRRGLRYIPYSGDGQSTRHNLFPQDLARYALESPTHGAAISQKQMLAEGQGIDFDKLSDGARYFFETCNDDFEGINDINEKIAKDFVLYDGFAIKVVWANDGTIAQIEHIPFEQVRCGEPDEFGKVNDFVISNNWNESLPPRYEISYSIKKFNPSIWESGADITDDGIFYTEDQADNNEQLIYYWNKRPAASDGMLFYPVPDYISGIDHILTEIQIGISNKALLENGFGGKYMMIFPFIPTEEERKEIEVGIKANFQGADKNGEIINMYMADEKQLPKLEKMEPLDADTYNNLELSVKQNIITAHSIPAILLEYNYGGGFNNRAEEMVVAYNQFQDKTIKAYQNKLSSVYRTILKYADFPDEQVKIIPFNMGNVQSNDTSLTQN